MKARLEKTELFGYLRKLSEQKRSWHSTCNYYHIQDEYDMPILVRRGETSDTRRPIPQVLTGIIVANREVLSSVSLNANRFEQTCGGEFLIMDNEEAFLALTKENIYSFMACIFLREPDPVTWPEQSQVLNDVLREMGQNPEHLGEIIPEQLNIRVENLRQEYFDCFFVPMSGKYVPPYESALLNYKAEKTRPYGTLNSPEAHHVAQCYKATGFTPQKLDMFAPLKEIQFPDHAGFELAFMAMISQAEKEAWENQNHEEAASWKEWGSRFLREHLVTWWPNFTLALEKMAPGYYAQVAKAVNIWILSELEESSHFIEEGRCRNLSS